MCELCPYAIIYKLRVEYYPVTLTKTTQYVHVYAFLKIYYMYVIKST